LKRRAEVQIYGEHFTIRTELPQELIEQIAHYVNGKMREVKGSAPIISTSTIAIMAALNIAEELFLLKVKTEEINGIIERKSTQLIDMLENVSSNCSHLK